MKFFLFLTMFSLLANCSSGEESSSVATAGETDTASISNTDQIREKNKLKEQKIDTVLKLTRYKKNEEGNLVAESVDAQATIIGIHGKDFTMTISEIPSSSTFPIDLQITAGTEDIHDVTGNIVYKNDAPDDGTYEFSFTLVYNNHLVLDQISGFNMAKINSSGEVEATWKEN